MKKKMKWARYAVLIMAVLTIISLDYKVFCHISQKDIESYQVETIGTRIEEVKKKKVNTKFKAVSEHLLTLDLHCPNGEWDTEGHLSYTIFDKKGHPVLVCEKVDIKDLRNEAGDRICLDVSEGRYRQGGKYSLEVKFQLKNKIELVVDAKGILHTQNYQVDYKACLYFLAIMINLLTIAGIFAVWKWGWNEKLFLVGTIAMGIFALVLTPPFSRDDEFRHFVRAYDWSYMGKRAKFDVCDSNSIGNVFSNEEGKAWLIEVPEEISELRLVSYRENYTNRSYQAEVNTSLCIPKINSIFREREEKGMVTVAETGTSEKGLESYWPQAMMIRLGRALGIRSGIWYYMAGIGQVLVTSLMLYAALLLSGSHKNLIYFFGLLPEVSLFRGSGSPDGLMMVEMILCLSFVLYLREKRLCLMSKKAGIIIACYFLFLYQIFLMKMPYALLCLGFLLLLKKENFSFLPWEWMKEKKKPLILGILSLCGMLMLYLFGIRKGDLLQKVVYAFLPEAYCAYILSHFGEFMHMYLVKGKMLLEETGLAILGRGIVPYGVLAGIVLIFSRKKFSLLWKGYQLLLFLIMLGLIVLVGYTLTPPDYGQIWGITYRYMLPALPIAGLAMSFGTEKTEECVNGLYPMLLIAAVFASCMGWLFL